MTLNLRGIKNETSYSLIITNLDNTSEVANCPPLIPTARNMWLGDKNRGIEIDIFYNGGVRKRLLYMYDYDWAIRYYEADRGPLNSIPVDSSKDFWLRLKDHEVIFECEDGSFTPGHQEVHRHSWRFWLEYDSDDGSIDLLDVWSEGRITYFNSNGDLIIAGFPDSGHRIYNLNRWNKDIGSSTDLIPKLIPVESWENPQFPIADHSVRFITSMNSPIIDTTAKEMYRALNKINGVVILYAPDPAWISAFERNKGKLVLKDTKNIMAPFNEPTFLPLVVYGFPGVTDHIQL